MSALGVEAVVIERLSERPFLAKRRQAGVVDPPATPPLEFSGHAGMIAEFVESLKNRSLPQTVCTDNIKSLAMVHAAIESAKTGQKVAITF